MAEQATTEVENKTQTASTEQVSTQGVETPKAEDAAGSEAPKSEPTPQVDYKAELERLQKQNEQAEHTIVNLKRENKALKGQPEEGSVPTAAFVEPEYTTAEELTRSIEANVNQKLEEQEAKLRREFASDVISEELSSMSSDPDEQKLIEFHYQNTIKQSGVSRSQIREDLRRARLIANEKILMAENEELKEALRAKNSVGKASVASNQDRQPVEDEPKFSPMEKAVIQRRADAANLSFKEFVRRHPELKK